jgi:hypothetical protein
MITSVTTSNEDEPLKGIRITHASSRCGAIDRRKTDANRLRPSQKIVTVCDKCLTESCWQGRFMCEESRTAGTITDTEENIAKLKPSELEQARREFMAVIDRFLRHV